MHLESTMRVLFDRIITLKRQKMHLKSTVYLFDRIITVKRQKCTRINMYDV